MNEGFVTIFKNGIAEATLKVSVKAEKKLKVMKIIVWYFLFFLNLKKTPLKRFRIFELYLSIYRKYELNHTKNKKYFK